MKIHLSIGALAFAVGAPLTLAAQQSPAATTPSAPPGFEIPKDMTTYYVALYVKGPRPLATESPEHAALTQRCGNRRGLEARARVAGPARCVT